MTTTTNENQQQQHDNRGLEEKLKKVRARTSYHTFLGIAEAAQQADVEAVLKRVYAALDAGRAVEEMNCIQILKETK